VDVGHYERLRQALAVAVRLVELTAGYLLRNSLAMVALDAWHVVPGQGLMLIAHVNQEILIWKLN
jgi:hypothetical protein